LIFSTYIDESYGDQVFSLASICATGEDWLYFCWKWDQIIEEWNSKLKAQGRTTISRYHASHLACLRNEFKDWKVDEQIAFSKQLLEVFRIPREMYINGYSIQLAEFKRAFPQIEGKKVMGTCYRFMLKLLMYELAKLINAGRKGRPIPINVSIFYDQGSFDSQLRLGFDQFTNDEGFEGREYFNSIAPLSWEDSTALQAADLLVYECKKSADKYTLKAGGEKRKSFQFLLEIPSLCGNTMIFGEAAIKKLKSIINRKELESI
jgi:hypothetical protein